MPALGLPEPGPQQVRDRGEGPVPRPPGGQRVDRLPRREVRGQRPPLAAGVQHVEQGIGHGPPPVLLRTAAQLRVAQHDREQRLQRRPLLVGQVAGIARHALPAAALAGARPRTGRGNSRSTVQ
jgi:hypothetical protein